jgi:hypothetical protein
LKNATSTKTCRRSTLTTRDNELCKDSYWAVRDIARDLSALSEMHTRMRGSSPTQRVRSSVRGAGDSLPCRRGHWPSLRTDLWRRFSTEAMLSLANDSICKQVPFTGAQHWRFSFAGRAWNAYKRTRLNFMTQLFFVCKELVCSAWGSSGRVRRPGSLAQLCFFSLLFKKRCHMRAA